MNQTKTSSGYGPMDMARRRMALLRETFDPTPLPPAIREWLQAHRETLAVRGSIIKRTESGRHLSYRLRVRLLAPPPQNVAHASLVIPAESVTTVRDQIRIWRMERLVEKLKCTPLSEPPLMSQEEAQALAIARDRRRCQDAMGGGHRRRKRVGNIFDEAFAEGDQDTLNELRFGQYDLPDPGPGRPRKPRFVSLAVSDIRLTCKGVRDPRTHPSAVS